MYSYLTFIISALLTGVVGIPAGNGLDCTTKPSVSVYQETESVLSESALMYPSECPNGIADFGSSKSGCSGKFTN